MITNIIIAILAVIAAGAILAAILLAKKTTKQSKFIVKQDEVIKSQIDFIKKFQIVVKNSDERLKKIDAKGFFRSDDMVGYFFKDLTIIQENINKFLINL